MGGFIFAGLAFLAAAQHPFGTYPASLFLLRKRPVGLAAPSGADRPTVAVCMSAFNEARVIVDKVESLIAMKAHYGPATLHVYVDGAEDETAALLRPYADRIDLVVSSERHGKTAGLNLLVARSKSELLAFTDANVHTPKHGLAELAAAFAQPDVGCATARLGYSNPDETGMSSAGSVYWRVEEAIKTRESRTVGVVGVDGAFFMMARSLYEPAPPSLIDDLYVSLIVFASDRRVVSAPTVQVWERSATRDEEEFARKSRIACQAVNVHFALWPRLSRMSAIKVYAYVSHRVLKWLIPFNLLMAGALIFAECSYRIGFFGAAAAVGLGASGLLLAAWSGFRPARTILSMLVSLAGVGRGVFQSLARSKTYTTWTPAASIRG